MLRVVTTNNSEVFRHFGSRLFQALKIEHTVATDYERTLELVRTKVPGVAILDADMPGGDGYTLCQTIKADPALASVRVMLVLPSVVTREQLERIEACGCDDVLAPPMHTDDLHCHLAQVAGVPFRRFVRQAAVIGVELSNGRPAAVNDISLGGLGLTIDGHARRGQEIELCLVRGDTTYPPIVAPVAWAHPDRDGGTRIGLRFTDLPIRVRLLIEQLCLFDERRDGDRVTIGLHGDFTETTDFTPLVARLHEVGTIDFDMREVRYLSSVGVRSWCQFLDTLAGKTYSFRLASIAFVSQVAMMPSACGTGTILSFEAPYRCDTCDRDDIRLLEVGAIARDDGAPTPPTLHCPTCHNELVFDDIPSRYLAFCTN